MAIAPGDLDLFLAEWVLRRITPEQAVQRALRAVEAGCDHQAVVVVAGSSATSRGEVEAEMPRLLSTFGRELPTEDEAVKVVVDDCVGQIVRREVEPLLGAQRLFHLWVNVHESVELMDQIRPLVDLAYDDDVHFDSAAARAEAIYADALAFIERGGVRLPL